MPIQLYRDHAYRKRVCLIVEYLSNLYERHAKKLRSGKLEAWCKLYLIKTYHCEVFFSSANKFECQAT